VTSPNRDRIDVAEQELEQWLGRHAEQDLPELVLVGLLRDYADRVERFGYVPRTWTAAARENDVRRLSRRKP
jgi:hypothetical protein